MRYVLILMAKILAMVGIGGSAVLSKDVGLWFILPWIAFWLIYDVVHKEQIKVNNVLSELDAVGGKK